ncbi:GDP dissociation inhibitor [Pilobolus umbonatus]|nr:GDP dissociation inhibitor [Pilobolus umbonatus]
MSMSDYPPLEDTHFDYIILGTGFIESVVAGSLARIGKKVLHLDSQENYGGNWSVFDFKDLCSWYLEKLNVPSHAPSGNSDKIYYQQNYASNFRQVKLILCPEKSKDQKEPISTKQAEEITKESILERLSPQVSDKNKRLLELFVKKQSSKDINDVMNEASSLTELLRNPRNYNLDTTPKLLASREELVETLIRSGVGRYLEFKNVNNVYVFDDKALSLDKVPSSKEDVFTNKSVSLIDKRKIMKFLTFAMSYSKDDALLEGTEKMTYPSFLKEKFKIDGKLLKAIVYAIALVHQNASVKEGLEATHQFVSSMGRFGKGAYLSTLYGGGSEISQAFCRICAVFGGVYILNKSVDRFEMDEKTKEVKSVVTTEGEQFYCKKLITNIDYLLDQWIPKRANLGTWIARGMCVSYNPLSHSDMDESTRDELGYSVFPPGSKAGNEDKCIYLIHQNHENMTCPEGIYVTYFWTISGCPQVIEKAMDLLLKPDNEDGSGYLFKVLYEQRVHNAHDIMKDLSIPANVIPCSDPDESISFQSAFSEAKNIFYQCELSDTEFMPPVKEEEEY